MLNASSIVSSPSRTPAPRALASAAAAVLNGADPLSVSDIPADHPALAPAVRELAAMTGDPVPAAYALPAPEGVEDLIALDPREQYPFPADAHEAEDHYQWARENGTDFDDHDNLPDSDPNGTDEDSDDDSDEGEGHEDYWFGRD
jgi:hypothetical protein